MAAVELLSLYHNNDNLLKLEGLTDEETGLFINNATVTAVLKHRRGGEVDGQAWPLAMAYVAASNGNYTGVIDAGINVVIGNRLTAEITVAAPGLDGFFVRHLVVVVRE